MRAGWHARRPSAAFAVGPPAMLARGAEPPGTPAIGGGGRLSGLGVEAGSAGFAGWLYAMARSAVADGDSGSVYMGNVPECP